MDFELSEDEAALAGLAATLAQREVAPAAAAAWAAERCPVEVLQRMGEAGLLGLLVPEKWGGSGASTVGFVAAMEQIGRADQSIAAAWQAHSTIGSLPILAFGSDEQRERWLRPLAEGRALGAFGLTETEAGSDAAAIRTRAEPRDGGWLINGRKMFISNAGTSMSLGVTLLARIGGPPGEDPAGEGLSEPLAQTRLAQTGRPSARGTRTSSSRRARRGSRSARSCAASAGRGWTPGSWCSTTSGCLATICWATPGAGCPSSWPSSRSAGSRWPRWRSA